MSDEFEALLLQPKYLAEDPPWGMHPQQPDTHFLDSGVLNAQQVTLRGVVLELFVSAPQRRNRGEKWVFKLRRSVAPLGATDWLLRMEIVHAPGLQEGEHDWPHLHRLHERIDLEAAALNWSWDTAFRFFCTHGNIQNPTIGHPLTGFKLRP